MKFEHLKNVLSRLSTLNSKESNKKLVEIGNKTKDDILLSTKNDEIYENLELLEEFVYKIPKQTVDIFEYILKTDYPVKKTKSKFGVLKGKTRSDIISKGLDLLSNVRYMLPEKILPLLEKVIANEEKSIREKALGILKKFSKYDYNILFGSKIGYGAQRFVLDYILKWSHKKCLVNLDFVLVVIEELLSSSVEGSSWESENKLTMKFSQVDPNDFLKKIRKEAMDLVATLYLRADAETRLKLFSALEEALRAPSNIAYSDAIKKMIDDDAKYLADIYRGMIFDKSGNIIKENVAVVEELEERLYYFTKPEERHPELAQLRRDILNDKFYNKICPLISGRSVYKNEWGHKKTRELRAEDIQKLISEINNKSIKEWKEILNILSNQRNVIEEWKFGDFKRFLERVAIEKTEIADRLLEEAYKEKSELTSFSESFLIGFQKKQKFDLWDKYIKIIPKYKDVRTVAGICASLVVNEPEETQKRLRPVELNILEEIVSKEGLFSFLKSKNKDQFNGYLHSLIFNALSSNFKQHETKMEKLIKKEIDTNPDYAYIYYNDFDFITTVRKWIDISAVSPSFKNYLLKKITDAPNLDWHLQEFLLGLCNRNFECIMNVFKKRISKYEKMQKADKSRGSRRFLKRKEYEAIPYHFNQDLQKFIVEHEDFSNIIGLWVKKMTLRWSYYNWEISRFLESLKANKNTVFSEIVSRSKDNDLLRISYAIESIGKADFNLCMKIIGKTNNERIHKKIGAIMYSTGTVSGEFGIAESYEGKIEMLKKYLDSDNKNVKKFASEMTESLKKSAKSERKRAEEEIQLRKIEFEG